MFVDRVHDIIESAGHQVTQTFGSGNVVLVDSLTLERNRESMRALYFASGDFGLAPYECREISDRFQDVMALVDNVFMQVGAIFGNNQPACHVVLEANLRDYRKNLESLRYELDKVR